jgi:hypothetical protein
MNCIEYIEEPRRAVASLFEIARKQVVVATDVWLGQAVDVSDGRCLPLRQKFVPEELVSWCPWPTQVRILDHVFNGKSEAQGFFVSRSNGDFSDLPGTIIPFNPNGKLPTQQRHEYKRL